MTVYQALDWACKTVVTKSHWSLFAILCSLLSRARHVAEGPSVATAEMWCEPKPYPPSVMTVVAQKPLGEVIAWQQGCECALCLLQDWCWATSEHLNEDRRILLRTMKAAVVDFAILLRAATWKRQNGGEDLPESGMIPA